MPSPICLANGEAITATLNFEVSQSVILSLANKTEVNSWIVEVIGNDNIYMTLDQAKSCLTYSNTTKLYTFSFGRGASAILLKSTINNGVDKQGNYQNSYSYNFELHVPCQTNSLRYVPLGSIDWLKSINAAIIKGAE